MKITPATLRRLLLSTTIAALGASWFAPADAAAVSPVIQINEATSKADITTQQLRGNISVLMGAGGNIVALQGAKGKFLVDAGISVSKAKLQAALAQVGKGPVKYVANTHWHWDHTDGNTWLGESGATIIAHPNTLKHISETTRVDDWNYTFKPLPKAGLPTILVKDGKTMQFGGELITLKNLGNGHTDGDLWIRFEKADVLVLGDTFWNGVYPFIDNASHGGINEAIKWANHAIEQSSDHTIIVPGHGPVGNRAQLIEFRDMLVTVRDKVKGLKDKGLTVEQAVAAKPTSQFDAKYGNFVINPDFFTRLVYAGL
ncbi:MBL fold metallo-hydrolase [Massilia niastensis]|uniref:MBL fold metallo-hydrolase n=1 Tax=Massilia niastensis TaxID=544911 RepID=UPI000368A575|nr:MBL fold metallo-hydrolase [Massilia niastensis]